MADPGNDDAGMALRPKAGALSRVGADLPLRAAAGVVMAAAAFGVAYVGGFSFFVFWGLVALGVVWEYQRLVGGERLWERIGLGALAVAAAAPFALRGIGHNAEFAMLALVVGAALTGWIGEPGWRVWAGAGVVSAVAWLVGLCLLRASPLYGFAAILWLFAIVWGTDVMAYFGGRLIGGPKLWPSVSPGKTWSGAIVGVTLGAFLGTLLAALMVPGGVKWVPMIVFGLVVSAASQAGDLFESAMKRRAGVKDSSRLIPGHGGLMDRLDGFIVAVAIAAIVAWARTTGDWIAPGLFQW